MGTRSTVQEFAGQKGHLPLPGPYGQAGGPKAPVSKTLDLSLSCKGKCRGGGNTLWPSIKKTREMAEKGAPDADPGQRKAQPGQGKASKVPGREGRPGGSLSPAGLSGCVMTMWPWMRGSV